MRRAAFILVAALLAPGFAALAAGPVPKVQHDSNAPIDISSDQFLADSNAKTGTWTGNVDITQGDMRMRANSVRMDVVENKPNKIYAQGNVVVDSPTSGTARGDNGVYDVVKRTVLLTGHVVLTKEKNVMRGTQLTVNLVTGQAKLGAEGTPGGRVQALFMPATNQATGGSKSGESDPKK